MAMQVKFPFGKLVSVLVTHVEEASADFFVQINNEAGKLDSLMAEIEQNVLSGKARPPQASEITVGCIYLAQYQEDNRWYRARVLGVNFQEQQCEAFFVDFGNTDFIPLSCIRNAEEKFCELAPQSFECELDGIDRLRGEKFDEKVALLNDTILEQELYCKAVQLKKNCVLVTQLFLDEKGTKSVFDEMQSGGVSAAADSLTNGDGTIPRKSNLKREVKYEMLNLPSDSFHDLSVTWVEDPSHFWCQLLSNTETIGILMENLAEVYTNLEPAALPLQSCTVGYPCCAKFYDDDAWYRGIITNVSSIATGQIEVRFVDYGNTQDTELSDVRDLKDEFLKSPCQAMYFAIAGVDPASKDGLWADEAKVLFEKLIKYKHVVGLVTSVENDGRHRVKLMDTTSDLDMELNQILIAANYGVKSADTPTTTTTLNATALNSSQPATSTTCQPVFAKENVQVGIEEKVLVTNIINPSKFYCQLFKNGPKLEGLMQDVGRHYSKLGANEELLSAPSPGDPCCAQFAEDGCWYRAVVLNTSSKGVNVQYIDYGNSELVPLNKIKKLIPKFSDLPQQGIECTLNRIKPKFGGGGEPKWKPCDTEKFMDVALEKEGKLTVITQDSSGVCRVELVVRNRKEEQNVSEQLLISGNAELSDGALPASENWNNLKSQTFPEPDLKVGHFEDVIVSYTEHPCDFWCQLQKSAAELDSLMAEISEHYSSEGVRNAISSPACGMLCCAQFTEDNKWYRGKITGIKKGGLVEVHFVDYGNYELLPLTRVKKLQAEYLKLPPQAVKCALAKISPSHKDLLSDEVMNRFEELTLNKELVMMADKYDEVSGTFAVVLLDTTEGNLDIASDLQTIMGPCTTREEAHIVGAQIQPGTTERVFVSSASSPAKFFCQLLKTSESLDELMNEMFEYYEHLSAQQEQMSKPSVGEFCAAKFTLDDGWYRAKVLAVQGNDVSVLYIDYGNSETLSLSRLKMLNSKFQSLPSQAIECSFSGNFKGVSDDKFLELVSEKEFSARVQNANSGVAVVDLVSKDTNQSICDILSKEGTCTTSLSCDVAQLQWKTGDSIDVYIPFAESAQKFFCHASMHSSQLDELMNRLDEHYTTDVESVSTLKAGSFCVAWYDGWYRAKVEKLQGKDVTVHFIDYGDTATVPLDSIRPLKPEFSSLPSQAVQCCLKGFSANQGPENFKNLVVEQEFKAQVISAKSGSVYEVDLVPGGGSVSISQTLSKGLETSPTPSSSVTSIQLKSGDRVDVFIPFVDSAQKFFCQVSQNSSDLDGLMNRLEEHYSSNQEIVTSITAETFCVAQYEDGGWYRAQVTRVQAESIEVFYIDYGNTATVPLGSIRSLKSDFSSLPAQAVKCCLKGYSTNQGPENFEDLVIEQEFSAQVTSVKANTYEVELISKDGSILFSRAMPKEMETTGESPCSVASVTLKSGDKVDVFIPFVDSAQKFFCQVSQNSSDLDDLMNRLEEHYSSNQETVPSITAETFCVAQYEDGGWYRAQVTQVQGESIEVFYIDYGNTATVPLGSIRSLKSEFSSLPAQAIKCCYSTNEPENFKDIVLEQEFDLLVIGSKQPGAYDVELFSKEGSKLFGETLPSETEKGSTPLSEICVGSFVQLCPTACVSPHLFHCQIATADHKEKLSQLMDQLQEHYEAIGDQEQSIPRPTVGMNCVSLFADDGLWYRGRITKVVDSQLVEVSYVDFGNSETVAVSKVKTIKEEWSQLAVHAVQCSIPSISPVSGVEWPDATVERFNNLTMQKKLVGKVIKKGIDDSLEIELFDTTDQSVDINIGELLVNEGLATHGTTKPQLIAVKSLTALGKVKPSANEKVYVTAVTSPGCFFCQLSRSEEKLTSLMSEISTIYDSLSKEELAVNTINVGDVFCAQFSDDNQWYRAVVEVNTDSELTVRFIDYGNTETLPISRTKILTDAFCGEPPLAIKCSLVGVQPSAGKTWSYEASTLLEELTLEKELDAKFLSFTEPFEVQLSDNSMGIGEELVKAKLALSMKYVAEPTTPGKPASEEFTKPVVECDKMYDVGISHRSSPGKFYCQLVDMTDQLDGMMTDMNNHYFQLDETEGCLVSPTVGQTCVALYEEMWFRAKVLSISVNDMTVHYVDYGNDETLQPSVVKQITPSFLKTPEVAIECSLDLNRDEWPEQSTALFEELTGDEEKKFIIKIVGNQGDRYEVKLFDTDANCFSAQVLSTIPGTAQEAQDVQEEQRTLKEPALKTGQTEDVCVVHSESSEYFYIQLSATYPQLEKMMAEIAEVYSGLADDVGPDDLFIGNPICALFSEDSCWYRAVIQSVPSDFEVEVQYVDYGNSDVVLLSDVRQLSKRFFGLPVQAVRCCLDSPNVESFEQRVLEKELTATFLSLEKGKWKVSLLDGDGKIGQVDALTVAAIPQDLDDDDIFQVREFIQAKINPEMMANVYVCHVVSPDEFYVQFESALDDLSVLSGEIGEFYSPMATYANVLKDPCAGMSCCAKFSEDGNWYRGRIKEVTSLGAEVEFVDYGNGEVVFFHEIKDPDKAFMQLPQQAILCGLDATKDVWSAQEVNIFKSVALDKSFLAKFMIRDGPKWRVSLDSGGVSVVDMFMTKDAAYPQQARSEISGVQMGSYTQPQLSSGQIEEVFVSYVTASGDFYIQLSKTLSELATIETLVSEIYDPLGPTTETMDVCFVDSLCCAKFSEDFKWYRAHVTKVFSDAEVEVLFVDYGNTEALRVESMKQLRPELLTFPVQAVRCRLEGSKDIWTESDVEQFEAKVLEKPLHVTFTRQEGTTWFVTIQELDMFSSKSRLTNKVKSSFSKENLKLNEREEAYFLFADSPDCFWLQRVRTGDSLVELMDQIANEVTEQPLEKSHIKVGLSCLGKYTENNMLHRAQILDIQDDANVTVSYIDYGNSETLSLDRLHPISDSFLKLPAQGIRCLLADMQGIDPSKITNYLNEVLVEKVVEVEVQNPHPDGAYTVKLFYPGDSLSINDQIVGECLGDTSLLEEARLEQASPLKLAATQERIAFKLPELQSGSKVPVSFVSAFLPAEMQLLLTDRIEERDQLTESITSMYKALDENELKLENPEVGMLCCVHFSEKWFRGEIISISADDTATVKLVDCGTYEKIPISELKLLKDDLLQTPVFVVESSLANIHPSSEDGQWSPECSGVLESLCRSKGLVAEITQVFEDMVELILNDESGKPVNDSLVDMGYAKACDVHDFSGEQPSLKWPQLQVGQCLAVYLMAVKHLGSIQLQLDDAEAALATMMEQLSTYYSNLGEADQVIGNPRVGQVCCAQFAEDHDWYRAVITYVSAAGVEVKFVDYGNIDVALMIKQLREEFFSLPVRCVDCSLHGVVLASENSEEEVAAKLMELCESKQLKAEIIDVSGDSVVVNLFDESGETRESFADGLVKLGLVLPQPTPQEEARRVSVSEEGKMVYNYPETGEDGFIQDVSLTSISSPSEFWCQLTKSGSDLKSLTEKIELFYQSLGENDLRLLCLQVGDICCAQFTDDDKWYRSQVNKVCSDGQVCVRSVDYVKKETLTLDKIKKLEAEFAVLPVQVLYCSLGGIEPPYKYYGEDWSSNAVGRFQELCEGKDFKIKIKGTDGDVTLVDLLDSASLSITNQLLSEGVAVEVKSPLTVSPVESPTKDVQKQQEGSSMEQAEEVDKESSEENVFEEAESGIEGVEPLAVDEERPETEESNEGEDDDEEEEFHDSNDQISGEPTSDGKKEISTGHECEKDEGMPLATEEEEKQAEESEEKNEEEEEDLESDGKNEEEEEDLESDGKKEEEEEDVESDGKNEEEEEDVESDGKKEEEEEHVESDGKKEEEEQMVENDEKKEEEVEDGLEKTAVEFVEEKAMERLSPESEERLEEDDKEDEKAKELESCESDKQSEVVHGEVKEEETNAQIGETSEETGETFEQLDETSEEAGETPEQIDETSEQIEETSEKIDETSEQIEETSDQIGETSEQIGEIAEQIGETSDASEEVEGQVEEQASDADTLETGGDSEKTEEEKSEEPTIEEGPITTGVSEEKDGGVDGQDEQYVEAQDVVTEAFSEEDLSAITGSAGEPEAAAAADDDEEWLKQSNLEEVVKQTSEAEESAKMFLEELLSDVCGSIDNQQSELEETVKECDTEDVTNSTITAEQPAETTNSDATDCDDVDDNVLSDEALDQLDKELEAESSVEKELDVTSTCTVVNGTGDPEKHAVVENGQDNLEQASISSCQDSKLSIANGNTEVGNELTVE